MAASMMSAETKQRMQIGPNAKLVFEKSSFSNQKSKHLDHIGKHTFNYSVSVILPGCDKLPEDVHSLCVEEKSYIVHNLPLSELIHSDLINAFMKRGSLHMLSHGTKIDKDDCIAVLPTGHLILNLCKDTYQQLGLERQPSVFSRKKPDKYVVDVDLFHVKFKPGTKKYNRVKWCFTDRLELNFDLLVSWTPGNDELCPSSIQKYFHMKGYKCSQLKTQHENRRYSDLLLPNIDLFTKHFDNCDSNPTDVFEWLGGLSTDIDLSCDMDSYISSYSYPGPTTEISHCVYQQYRSFYSPDTICLVMEKLRQHIKSGNFPWCSLTVHGFLDSPVSWGTKEHGLFYTGDNMYTFIILPDDQYWLYSATSEHDLVS